MFDCNDEYILTNISLQRAALEFLAYSFIWESTLQMISKNSNISIMDDLKFHLLSYKIKNLLKIEFLNKIVNDKILINIEKF